MLYFLKYFSEKYHLYRFWDNQGDIFIFSDSILFILENCIGKIRILKLDDIFGNYLIKQWTFFIFLSTYDVLIILIYYNLYMYSYIVICAQSLKKKV